MLKRKFEDPLVGIIITVITVIVIITITYRTQITMRILASCIRGIL